MLNSALGALRGSIYRSPARTLLPGPCGVKRRSQRVHLSRSRTPTVPRALSSLSLTSLAAPATGHRTCRCAVDHARDRGQQILRSERSRTPLAHLTHAYTHTFLYTRVTGHDRSGPRPGTVLFWTRLRTGGVSAGHVRTRPVSRDPPTSPVTCHQCVTLIRALSL